MRLVVQKLNEAGYQEALFGISLNKEQSVENMPNVAEKLAKSSLGSHRKFLRQIVTWWHMVLPRHILTELDTYKVGTVRNSGSTMHNIHKRMLTQEDFVRDIPYDILFTLNESIGKMWEGKLQLHEFKDILPEGYLQPIVYTCNYETLRTIYNDRKNHRMPEWRMILNNILDQVEHPEFIK